VPQLHLVGYTAFNASFLHNIRKPCYEKQFEVEKHNYHSETIAYGRFAIVGTKYRL
jgi:hypothetical protein